MADIYQLLDEAEYNMKNFADVEGVAEARFDIYISLYIIRKRNQAIVCVFLKIISKPKNLVTSISVKFMSL